MVKSALPDKTKSGRSLLFIVDANLNFLVFAHSEVRSCGTLIPDRR